MKYLFLLGRNNELSKLEIYSFFNTEKISFKIISEKEDYLIIESKINPEKIINNLGGTIKIFENISISDFLNFHFPEKFIFKLDVNKELRKKIKEKIRNEHLKAIEKPNITPSQIHKLKLPFFEFIERENLIFKISAITNPNIFKELDEKLPFRDPKIEISFRLAKILVNISGAKEGKVLLDPFCGTGTILCIGLEKNCRVIGVDIDEKRIKEAQENLRFFCEYKNIPKNFEVLNADAREISKYIKFADIIVTEPYLGPLLKKIPKREEIEKILKELYNLYSTFLFEASKILKEKMIIILPYFKLKNEILKLNYEEMFKKANFKVLNEIEYSQKNKLKRKIYILTLNNFTGTR
ncbi:MAG: methyltransferase domain-containing protein [Candidatus Aenigmatarchaeota archaeon]